MAKKKHPRYGAAIREDHGFDGPPFCDRCGIRSNEREGLLMFLETPLGVELRDYGMVCPYCRQALEADGKHCS